MSLQDSVPVCRSPASRADVVAKLPQGEVFTAIDDGSSSSCFKMSDGRGFVFAKNSSGDPLVQSLVSRPFRVDTVILNPAPYESRSATDEINLALPLSGVPQEDWPRFAEYIWSDKATSVKNTTA